jgi:dTMP kinase
MKGQFITIEGVEGVGKTTNIAFIRKLLTDRDIHYVVSREPGGTAFAEKIRDLLLSHHRERICEMTELLMIFAARAQHIEHVIAPALDAGKWVVCDRFTDATYAYQGGGRGLDINTIARLESMVQGVLRPALTLILDLPPEIGLQRARTRGDLDRFEEEKIDFFNRVRENYLQRAALEPNRCKVIDASLPLASVQSDIRTYLEEIL